MKKHYVFWWLLLCLGCTKNKRIASNENASSSNIKYAKNFALQTIGDSKEIILFHPKNNHDTIARYLLIRDYAYKDKDTHMYDGIIQIPVSSIAVTSSTYIGMLAALGLQDRIVGTNIPEKIYDRKTRQLIGEKRIRKIGGDYNINCEILLEIKPEVFMVSIFYKDKLVGLNNKYQTINFIYNLDWLEQTPLSRAEWIKFVAAFFDKDKRADSIFNTIEKRYHALKNMADTLIHRPSILAGSKYKNVWYTPGGHSYMAQFFKDAGGQYLWSTDNTKGSIPLSFEAVFEKQTDADVWILPEEVESKKALYRKEPGYAMFTAFKKNQIYSYHKMIADNGANAWWENAIINPDIVLKDMIKIFHPELLPAYETQYLKRIE